MNLSLNALKRRRRSLLRFVVATTPATTWRMFPSRTLGRRDIDDAELTNSFARRSRGWGTSRGRRASALPRILDA
jgi:hypothetical protein